jgi:hypothetical protein
MSLRKPALAAAATVVAALTLTSSAFGFGSVSFPSFLHQNSEHERLTRVALQCANGAQAPACFQPSSLDNVAGTTGTFGAVSAADDLIMHNTGNLGPLPRSPLELAGILLNGINDQEFWHCDGADYGDPKEYGLKGAYPQTRAKADSLLRECLAWGKAKLQDGGDVSRFKPYYSSPQTGAVAEARNLLKSDGTVAGFNVAGGALGVGACTFNGSTFPARPKCNVLEPWGYVLHMAEDFYSHTNWGDYADPSQRISVNNAIGLGRSDLADFLDLRRALPTGSEIPDRFTGGCFPDKKCANRILHGEDSIWPWGDLGYGVNKDKGIINTSTGATSAPYTRRGKVVVGGKSNFQRAVDLAVGEARRQWSVFRQELAARYGTNAAAKMACALTVDDFDICDKRTVVLAVDTSTPPSGGPARALAAQKADEPAESAARRVLDTLTPHDEVSVLTFDSSTGAQDADPFTAPTAARIDDANAGDPEPDPTTVDDGVTPTEPDPSVTLEPDPVVPTDDEGNPVPPAEDAPEAPLPPSPPLPTPPAQPTAAPAQALNSAAAALADKVAPQGQQGVILITNRIGDAGALATQIRGLGDRGAVVSLALYGGRPVPSEVIAAVQATGGTVLSTDRVAELRRFAGLADAAGLTRLDDLLGPDVGAPLDVKHPAVDGVIDGDASVHDVESLPGTAALTVRSAAPVTVRVRDNATGTTTVDEARRGAPAVTRLAAGGDYTVSVAGPSGRRYEVEVS